MLTLNASISRTQRRRAFLLLEVVLALGILALASTVLMRSYALGAEAVLKTELITTSCMLAEGLIDELEIVPPENDRASGDFGENYPNFTWHLEVEREKMNYRYAKGDTRPDGLKPLVTYSITIRHEPENAHKSYVPLHFSYHPTLVELFSVQAKFENQLLGDDI